MDFLSSSNSILLGQKGLDNVWEKQKVIMDNIANAETPGYKAKYVTFENELKNRISLGETKAGKMKEDILDSKVLLHTSTNESARMDGNNVQIDAENSEMVRAIFQYQYLTRLVNDEFTRLRTAIKG